MQDKKKLLILETTLREGEQTTGVSFTPDERVEIARLLDECGVDMIEAGHPAVSPDVKEGIKKVADERLEAEIVAHSMARKSDVDLALSCDVDWVGIFLPTSDIHRRARKFTEERVINMAVEAVTYAKEHGLKVRFTCEDASRTEVDYLARAANAAADAGAERISVPDTAGVMMPFEVGPLFQTLSKKVKAELDGHFHNDLGMAVANALEAVRNGATCIHVTCNNLGERCGIVDLSTFAVVARLHLGHEKISLEKLPEASLLVERLSGILLSAQTPVIGENAFSHKGGLHTAAVLVDPRTYEAFPPDLIGRHRDIIVDKYAGRQAVKAKLEKAGINLSEEQLGEILKLIKENPAFRNLKDPDLVILAERVTGQSFTAMIPTEVEAIVRMQCFASVQAAEILKKIADLDPIKAAYEISGEYDAEMFCKASSMPELNAILDRIRAEKGIQRTDTRLVLKQINGQLKSFNDNAINALMLIQCESNVYTTGIARNVSKIAQVYRVYEVSGQYDIEALLSGNTMNEINGILEQIRAIRGIRNTCTRFIFKTHKRK